MLSLAAVAATFVAGLASFLAPCTVPLLPAYLAVVSGAGAADLTATEPSSGEARPSGAARRARRLGFRGRLLAGSLLYVAGFTTVFIVLGLTAGSLGRLTQGAPARAFEIAGGVLIFLFGLLIIGVVRLAPLERVYALRLPRSLQRRGVAGAFLVGAVFGVGWTPCVGPYLAAALTLAAVASQAAAGAVLLAVYSIGLGMPFIVVALLWASLPQLPRRLTRFARPVTFAGGLVTAALGVLLATGAYTHLTSYLAQLSTPS
jgi:cytochrome c-type biogenesis protein